jgi:hypothetical protein
MKRLDTRRDGFALPAAIVALVLVGVLVTGGFVAATQEGHISESTRLSGEAFNIAELGLNEFIGGVRVVNYGFAMAPAQPSWEVCRDGSVVLMPATCSNGAAIGTYTVQVRPLGTSDELFMVQSTGKVTRHGQYNEPSRTLATVVRSRTLDIAMDRAVTVGGPLHTSGNAEINGEDAIPGTFYDKESCTSTGTQAGVVAKDPDQVTTKGNSRIKGEPPKRGDESIDSISITQFGDLSYEDLTEMATFTIPNQGVHTTGPKLKDGRCDYSDQSNWGSPLDPNHLCKDFFPIIHVTGSLHMNSKGSGQGILLVDEDLKLNGGYEFYGIVIVMGKLEGGNGGAKIYGGTIVRGGANLDNPSEVQGNPVVNLSSCAIERAVQNNDAFAFAKRISSRSWFDLSAVGVGM